MMEFMHDTHVNTDTQVAIEYIQRGWKYTSQHDWAEYITLSKQAVSVQCSFMSRVPEQLTMQEQVLAR